VWAGLGALDITRIQLSPISGVAVPARQATLNGPGRPEYLEISYTGIGILTGTSCVNPASIFRHQGQAGSAGHGLVRGIVQLRVFHNFRCSFSSKTDL